MSAEPVVRGTIRIDGRDFEVATAALTWLSIPDGTLLLWLSVSAKTAPGAQPLHFRLEGIRVPGRTLEDLAGQVTSIPSGLRPDPYTPRVVYGVATLYLGSHEETTANRVTWGTTTPRGLEVVWTGIAPDLDRYDAAAVRQPFVLQVEAPATAQPFELVRGGLIYAEQGEHEIVQAAVAAVIPDLAADLARRDWFADKPFWALDLIARVDGFRRRWSTVPPRLREYASGILVTFDARQVRRASPDELRRALARQVTAALAGLDARHARPAAPRRLT